LRWGRGRLRIFNIDSNFHSSKATATTINEIICLGLIHLEYISTSPCDILYEAHVVATFIACLVHLKNTIKFLVESKILERKREKCKKKINIHQHTQNIEIKYVIISSKSSLSIQCIISIYTNEILNITTVID
jgi:hypothetical protein